MVSVMVTARLACLRISFMTLQRLQRAIGYVLMTAFLVSAAAGGAPSFAQGTKPAAPPAKPAPGATPGAASATPAPDPALGPMLVIETVKGTIHVQLFAKEAPKSVEQVVRLAKGNFYNQQKVHRVVPGQIVQWGDKQSRDATLREWWGKGASSGSGKPIGVAEISKTRKHKAGTVGMANTGDPRSSDSQMYIALRPMPNLDGKHNIIGEVKSGMAIVPKLAVADIIKKVTVIEPAGT
jgi:cyclophilin family peptidyl-prolyl cis-trans isomerase